MIIKIMCNKINMLDRNILIQKAGKIIIDKYNNYNNIPDKYKFLYEEFIPNNIGNKRKIYD